MTAPYTIERPEKVFPLSEIPWKIVVQNTTLVENVSAIVYVNLEDVTSTRMISGDSHAVNGNVITLKKITALATDELQEIVVLVKADLDGVTDHVQFGYPVLDPKEYLK